MLNISYYKVSYKILDISKESEQKCILYKARYKSIVFVRKSPLQKSSYIFELTDFASGSTLHYTYYCTYAAYIYVQSQRIYTYVNVRTKSAYLYVQIAGYSPSGYYLLQ